MFRKNILVLLCFVILVSLSTRTHAEETMSKEALRAFILETIRKNPQVLLDVLRNNSIALLDIAQEGSNLRKINALKAQWKKDLGEKKIMHCEDRPVYGNKNAKVRIVAFSDFTCHYCYNSKSVIDKILKEYTGKVAFIYKSCPMIEDGPAAIAAAWFLAIAKQDEAKAWKFYDNMFENRNTLQSDGEDFIRNTAQSLNLDLIQLEKDVKSDKKIMTLLREDRDDADKLNVEGTPCFYVNNLVVRGAIPLEFFRVAVNMALKDAE